MWLWRKLENVIPKRFGPRRRFNRLTIDHCSIAWLISRSHDLGGGEGLSHCCLALVMSLGSKALFVCSYLRSRTAVSAQLGWGNGKDQGLQLM